MLCHPDRYPDATPEELQAMDNVCIICREEMVTGAKRLPCNHIFHTRWVGPRSLPIQARGPRELLTSARSCPPAACAPGSRGSRPALPAVWMSYGHHCQPSRHRPLSLRIRAHPLPLILHHSCPSPLTVSVPSLGHPLLSGTCLGWVWEITGGSESHLSLAQGGVKRREIAGSNCRDQC